MICFVYIPIETYVGACVKLPRAISNKFLQDQKSAIDFRLRIEFHIQFIKASDECSWLPCVNLF